MGKLLTIKIAGCGVEPYLPQCLGTFADKKYEDYLEVIVVVNYCTDRSLEIAKNYEKEYPNIFKVIPQGKENYASTYNVSFNVAEGKYFTNIDGDDYFDCKAFEQYIELLKMCDSDIVASDFLMFTEDGRTKKVSCGDYEHGREYKFDEVCVNIPYIQMHSLTVKTDIIKNNHITVDLNSIAADAEYTLMISPYIKTITFFKQDLYYYRQGRPGQDTGIEKLKMKETPYYNDNKRLIEWLNSLTDITDNKRKYIAKRIANMVDVEVYILLLQRISKSTLNKIKNYKKEIIALNKMIYKNTAVVFKIICAIPITYPLLSIMYRIYKKNKKFLY